MNEEPGTTAIAADSGSGSAVPMTLMGARFLGGVAGGVELDGAGDYLDFGDRYYLRDDRFAFAATNGFSFAAWVRHDAFAGAREDAAGGGFILYLWDGIDGTEANWIWLSNHGTSRRATVNIANSLRNAAAATSTTPWPPPGKTFTTPDGTFGDSDANLLFFPPAGQWVHVVWTVNTTGTFALYRDGATRTGWQTSSGYAANPNPPIAYRHANLGGLDWWGDEIFHGALRDVRLYNYALSAEQVRDLHASTAPWGHSGSGPIHWWKMDEAVEDKEAADSGSDGNEPLTLKGSAVFLGPDAGGGASLPNGDVYNRTSFLDFGSGGITFGATNGLTFAVWVNFATNAWSYILYLANNRAIASNAISLYHRPTGRRAGVSITNGGWSSTSNFYPPDAFFPVAESGWAHVALTVGADGAWTLYRDGATQDDWKTASGYGTADPNPAGYWYAALGRHATHNNGYWLDGALRDARLYNRALSAEQVRDLHASTALPNE